MAPNQVTQQQPDHSLRQEKCVEEFKSRKYQNEILKSCIEQNTIIYLPTGAGKTHIAILALRHFAKSLEKPISKGGKLSVFLTHSKALALQQAEVIDKTTPLNVRVYTGDMNVDAWSRERWNDEFKEAQVIVATVQIILNLVNSGYIKISDFNLMIFDECHNAQKDAPMVLLMAKFNNYPANTHPRVIGLTGMLTASSIKPINVLTDLSNLEAKFRATIKTAHGDSHQDVLQFSTCPTEEDIVYETNAQSDFQATVLPKVVNMVTTINEWLMSDRGNDKQQKVLKQICDDFNYQLENLGLYGGLLANLAAIVDLELKKREAGTASIILLSRALITNFEEILHMTTRELNITEINELTTSTILLHSSPKVQALLKFVRKTSAQKKDMKGLIFVQRRFTARILCHVIRRYFDKPENAHLNVHVDFMTGGNSNAPESIETIISARNNNLVLDKFKSGTINLIIATSVLEEGIDLQECNFVVSFDVPQNFRSYVQSKGRARMKSSIYAIMIPVNEVEELNRKRSEWNQNSTILKEYLVERAVDRPPPQQDDIDRINEKKYDEIKLITKNNVTCNYREATQLLNQYCVSLPKDRFTDSLPQFENVLVNEPPNTSFVVRVVLPIQCPLKEEILSDPLPSLKLAKRSAAFKAIKTLYECGELSENLKPLNAGERLQRFDDVYFKTWTKFQDDNAFAGTKKNTRTHDIRIPTALKDSMPQIGMQCYLYKLLIQPNFTVHETQDDYENIRVFHQLLQSQRTYGILTTKPLPRMGEMKFYQSFGEMKCNVSNEPVSIKLSKENKLKQLKRFHCILFRNVLDIWEDFFVYDHTDSVMIVPTLNDSIDWSIVERFQSWSNVEKKSIEYREAQKFNEIDWRHSVVCPWYRADDYARYVVTEIVSSKTPLSPFPEEKFPNYATYITKTYGDVKRIANPKQFLISVKPLTTHLNRLNAGDGEDGRRTARVRGPEYLIPELCHNFRYPGDLWLKAIVLPSALHRITYILHAESLRVKINDYIGLTVKNYEPKPLIDTMARKKETYAKSGIKNPTVHPRMEENIPEELTINEIPRFDEKFVGKEGEEPVDLERYFDSVHEVDINYYFEFMKRDLANLQANHSHNSAIRKCANILLPNQFQKNVPALCDIKEVDKERITLLDIKLATPLKRGIEQHEMLAAITSASSADVFHNEILEVLGDAFLKFSISLYLIQRHIDWHEGFLTTIKGQMVGNRNLCYSAIRHGLPGMIKIRPFNPKEDWQPPMLKVNDFIQEHIKDLDVKPDILYELEITEDELENGHPSDEKIFELVQKFPLFLRPNDNTGAEVSSLQNFLGQQTMSDKSCADCIEAILGTCVKTIGIERTFKVLEMLEIVPRNGMDITKMLQKKLRSPRIRTDISNTDVDEFLVNHKILEKSIGYAFNERAYLLQALTHPSYPTNRITGCYQQLEFLGDAVLDFLITAHITERCPYMDPGQLTDLRSALVNNATLACLCVRYNIHTHILYQNSSLSETIGRFVDFQNKNNHEIIDHVELLMSESDVDCNMAEYTDIPKTLGDVFEAIIGGIFLDSGNNLEKTWQVIYRLMITELDKFMVNVPIQLVRQLYEYPNAQPQFDDPTVNGDVVCVKLRFTCNGKIRSINGFGVNKENAKKAAAKLALSILIRT